MTRGSDVSQIRSVRSLMVGPQTQYDNKSEGVDGGSWNDYKDFGDRDISSLCCNSVDGAKVHSRQIDSPQYSPIGLNELSLNEVNTRPHEFIIGVFRPFRLIFSLPPSTPKSPICHFIPVSQSAQPLPQTTLCTAVNIVSLISSLGIELHNSGVRFNVLTTPIQLVSTGTLTNSL